MEQAETPTTPRSFADMNLEPAVAQALDEMGYQVPMEVQTVIYRRAVDGRDLMVQSRTGSGKTAAFGIPIAQLLSSTAGLQALILAPTRELALQVSQELGKICTYKNLQVVPVYGGAPMGRQIEALKAGAQVVAGTPGRVLDHIRRGTLKTKGIKILVLDECDEMLSMGFQEEIEKILSELSKERQTLLFSATIPEEIERIARRHMREPEKVVLSADFIGVHEIRHRYYLVSGLGRTRDLLRILEYERPDSALIFCNTREDTGLVASFLQRHGYDAEAISSDLTQADRERVMARMRVKGLKFLCATDIAARGIDISDLPYVINYTFPESPEVYIHRTGRTGRAGKSGQAISLIGPREIGSFYYLKLLYKIRPEERELPSEDELRTRREAERYADLAARVTEDAADEWKNLARRVWQSAEGERLVGALLKRALEGPPPERPTETAPERPAVERAAIQRPTAPAAPTGDRRPPREARERRPERSDRPERRGPRDRPDRRDRRPEPPARTEGQPPGEEREFWEAWVDDRAAAPAAPSDPRERPPRERVPQEPGFARLYVNVGKREGILPEEITRFVGETAPELAPSLGRVQVLGTHSYLSVKEEAVDNVIAALQGKKLKDRDLVVERARK